MKKRIYYTVEREIDYMDSITGVKIVFIYHIVNDDLVRIGSFDCLNEENTEFRVESFLLDIGYKDFELVCL